MEAKIININHFVSFGIACSYIGLYIFYILAIVGKNYWDPDCYSTVDKYFPIDVKNYTISLEEFPKMVNMTWRFRYVCIFSCFIYIVMVYISSHGIKQMVLGGMDVEILEVVVNE
jgi:hypothetical protein